ncbi:MAG: ABC transporter ATP-binding protein [Promethearchaeota archaeon]
MAVDVTRRGSGKKPDVAGKKGEAMFEFGPILEVVDLKKYYQTGAGQEIKALDGISFEVMAGEFISIMGPSGSGKTTLLNLIAALDTPTGGEVLMRGRPTSSLAERELTRFRRKEVGLVFQYYNLFPVLTVLENVELPMLIAGEPKAERLARARYLLEAVGLGDRLDHRPDELSGGQMQRVAIARALVNRPAVVLADEPTGDVDSKTGGVIMALFDELNELENQTFLIVTHDREVAERTRKTLHLRDGRLEKVELHYGAKK